MDFTVSGEGYSSGMIFVNGENAATEKAEILQKSLFLILIMQNADGSTVWQSNISQMLMLNEQLFIL